MTDLPEPYFSLRVHGGEEVWQGARKDSFYPDAKPDRFYDYHLGVWMRRFPPYGRITDEDGKEPPVRGFIDRNCVMRLPDGRPAVLASLLFYVLIIGWCLAVGGLAVAMITGAWFL